MESLKSPPQPSGQERLKVGWEQLPNIAREMRYLGARQQAEVGEGFEPFNPDWDAYFAYARAGSAAAWTARTVDTGVLAGYIIWLTTRGLHCVDTLFANADLVYLAPEWREGLTGYKLLKTGIEAVRPRVNIVRVEVNDLYEGGRLGVLLKRLKFTRIGSVWQSGIKQSGQL